MPCNCLDLLGEIALHSANIGNDPVACAAFATSSHTCCTISETVMERTTSTVVTNSLKLGKSVIPAASDKFLVR